MKWTIPTVMQERIKTSNISATPGESFDDVRHEIVKALCFWSAQGKIDFEETASETDAHLKFQFGYEAVKTHDTGNEVEVKKLDASSGLAKLFWFLYCTSQTLLIYFFFNFVLILFEFCPTLRHFQTCSDCSRFPTTAKR